MLVALHNFDDICPRVLKEIKECSFVAIDFEFTGLFLDEDRQPSLFDSLENRYEKMRSNVQHFIPCQFGLSIFAHEPRHNRYNSKTYSFYCCPRWFGAPSASFSAEIESIEFLADNSFNFNMFAHQGIPFLNEEQEKKCRHYIRCKEQIKFPMSFHDLLIDLTSEIASWLAKRKTSKDPSAEKKINFKKFINSFNNYLLVNELRNVFPNVWVDLDESPPSALVVRYVTQDERQSLEANVVNEEEKIIDYCLGLTRVIRGLIEIRKPIVGNNMMVDLVVFLHHFIQPLPAKLSEFKKEITQRFPGIYDLKSIVNNVKKNHPNMEQFFQARGLFEMYQNCRQDSFIRQNPFQPEIIEVLSGENPNVIEKPHDAGFDAYATGYSFIRVATLLTCKAISRPESFSDLTFCLKDFNHKINLIRAPSHYLDLLVDNQKSVRPEWLVLSCRRRSATLSYSQVYLLLSPFEHINFKRLSSSQYILAVGSFKT